MASWKLQCGLKQAAPWLKLIARQYCDAGPLLALFQITLPTIPGVC